MVGRLLFFFFSKKSELGCDSALQLEDGSSYKAVRERRASAGCLVIAGSGDQLRCLLMLH